MSAARRMRRERERCWRHASLKAARAQGCLCLPEFAPDTVAGVPVLAVRHDIWCPLLRVMEERPPGLARSQVLFLRERAA